jgi:hypothetical protein
LTAPQDFFKWAQNAFNTPEMPMAPRMQAMGASVNINRTMTPAKYQEIVPYRIKKILASPLSFKRWNRKYSPTGANGTMTCKSKKNDVQAVGWCSDTDAMMGMYFLAYVGSNSVKERPVHCVRPVNCKQRSKSVNHQQTGDETAQKTPPRTTLRDLESGEDPKNRKVYL